DKEEARLTRADRSLIRQCIIDAAKVCVVAKRTVLTQGVADVLGQYGAFCHDADLGCIDDALPNQAAVGAGQA
ncbi:hypothetical protein QCD79_33835, partial [Pseudomonas quasicaspiana]|nr:hypothetical protein [Pseudomonas quasicaspiana]